MRGVVIAVVLLTGQVAAQPSTDDKARAKEMYKSAEAAMAAQDYTTAVRDYGAAYEITRDPVLFYKIGTANERAGKCPVAVIYYRRYLAEAKPTPAFVDITNARIKACEPAGAVADKPLDKPADKPADKPLDKPADKPSDKPLDKPADKPIAKPADKPADNATDTVADAPTSAPTDTPSDGAKDNPKTAMGTFVGPREGDKNAPVLTSRNRTAWLFVTGSIALVTIGAVLAYSADSAESDINDLYVGLSGNPPVFDRQTKALYDDLVAEGERYETLSWGAFGLAGVTAGVAAILFWRESRRPAAVTVTPTVQKDGAGVRAVFSF